MDYALNEDQAALVAAVQQILQDHAELPQSARLLYHYFDAALQQTLADYGFLDAARDMSPLEAALVVIEASRIPASLELGVSALVAPGLLPDEKLEGPVALVEGRALHKAHRNLSIARTALLVSGEDVVIVPLREGDVVAVDTIFAYPFGRFRSLPELETYRRLHGAAATLRQWQRVALAAEFAGAARSAVAFTVNYVKERQAFGHPIGTYQAIQHRLAQCHQIVCGIHYLTLRAAWSRDALDADLAASYAQQHVQKILFDLHQFNGAMGVTNEHTLHFWTYRLRALQAEAGGGPGAALAIADKRWGAPATVGGHCR